MGFRSLKDFHGGNLHRPLARKVARPEFFFAPALSTAFCTEAQVSAIALSILDPTVTKTPCDAATSLRTASLSLKKESNEPGLTKNCAKRSGKFPKVRAVKS